MPVAPSSILLPPEQSKGTKTFDFNLEALRGFAAIVVVWHHVIYHQHWLDPGYTPTGIIAFNPSGHLSVLVFFVLSGYVIGRVHLAPLTRTDILPYLKKRFVRIYPIFLVTMLAGLLVARGSYPTKVVVGNLAMLQNFYVQPIFENNPAWSLNSEVLFYLLFISLSFFRLNSGVISVLVVAFGSLGVVSNVHAHYEVGAYALGFAFWLCGVLLARNFQRPRKPSFALMVSMLLLLLAIEQFNTLAMLFYKAATLVMDDPGSVVSGRLKPVDLGYLPYCLVVVLVFASKKFAHRKHIVQLLLLAPAFTFYNKLLSSEIKQNHALILPACFYVAALLIYYYRRPLDAACRRFIHRLSSTGAWSYGLYMIHFPIIALFIRINWFAGTALTFSVRLLIYLALCFSASYFLEKKFQPWIRSVFYKK